MKRFPKLLQPDSRGQLVIPKEIRQLLNIDESTGFFAYVIENEGIFLKKIESKELHEHKEIKELADKHVVQKKNVEKAEQAYKKEPKAGGFEEL